MKSIEVVQPKLQAPGAGLPLPQMLLARLWLGPVASKRSSWERSRQTYEGLTAKIIERIEKTPPELRDRRVLIAPQIGLEDSSRYWSLNETAEHLVIVGKGVESIILRLAAEETSDLAVDTAKVKPQKAGRGGLDELKAFAPWLMKSLDQRLAQPGMNRESRVKHAHPWMGPFTAAVESG